MAARTEVLLGGSPHDPGARCAGSSVSGRAHLSQHRGHLRGFGCAPGPSPGVAPDGDDAHSRPQKPHRGETSGSARGERRSKHRARVTSDPRQPMTERSATGGHTRTAQSRAAWHWQGCSLRSLLSHHPDRSRKRSSSAGNAELGITAIMPSSRLCGARPRSMLSDAVGFRYRSA